MKPSKRYLVNPAKIHSLKDIELEKQRLRMEIMKTENNINAGYHNLLHAFTFKNFASSVVNDLTTTSSVVSKAFSIGKALIEKRRKKKRMKDDLD